jgi:hypothetical protein
LLMCVLALAWASASSRLGGILTVSVFMHANDTDGRAVIP